MNKPSGVFFISFLGFIPIFLISLLFLFISNGYKSADGFIYFLQLITYLVISKISAEKIHRIQERESDHLHGIKKTAISASIFLSLLMWIFRIVRDIALSAKGYYVDFEPIFFFGWVVFDVLVAISIGSLMGNSVERKYGKMIYWD